MLLGAVAVITLGVWGWVAFRKGMSAMVMFEDHIEIKEFVLRHILSRYTLLTDQEVQQCILNIGILPRFNLVMSIDGIRSYETNALSFQVTRLAYMTKNTPITKTRCIFKVIGDVEHPTMTDIELDAFLAKICHSALFDKTRQVTVRFAFDHTGLTITHEPIEYIHTVYRISAVNL